MFLTAKKIKQSVLTLKFITIEIRETYMYYKIILMTYSTITEKILGADWSRAMVYKSKDHGNDVTCHVVLVVLSLFFRK